MTESETTHRVVSTVKMEVLIPLEKFRKKYRTQSLRLPGWDYAELGWYFVTLCTRNMSPFFGSVEEGAIRLNRAGKMLVEEWKRTRELRPQVELDEWVVMPNHFHGILVIKSRRGERWRRETIHGENKHRETTHRGVSRPRLFPNSLGSIIGQFKSISTKRIQKNGFQDFAWQAGFYEHVIRSEQALGRIREYIVNNPLKWHLDRYYPSNWKR